MSHKKLCTSHTEQTTANATQIWSLWADVDNWPVWDKGLDTCSLEGRFQEGDTFLLKPQGADEAIRAKFINVSPNHGFTDITQLPFGELRSIHTFNTNSDGNSVTHTIQADIANEHVEFFTKVIWESMKTGLPQSVRSIVQLAEKKA